MEEKQKLIDDAIMSSNKIIVTTEITSINNIFEHNVIINFDFPRSESIYLKRMGLSDPEMKILVFSLIL